MTSKFETCIFRANNEGVIPDSVADELREDIKAFQQKAMEEGADDTFIWLTAPKMAILETRVKKKRTQYQKSLQVLSQARNLQRVRAHVKPEKGLTSLIDKDLRAHQGNTAYSNVHYRTDSVKSAAFSRWAEGLAALETKWLGFKQDTKTLNDTVRELFGESTGNTAAAKAAKGFSEASEYLRGRSNRAGSFIAKRDDWGLPQGHDDKLVRQAGEEKWLSDIAPLLDVSKMVDDAGLPLSQESLDKALRSSFYNIVTNGKSAQNAGKVFGSKVANRHQDSRFLVFKDADSWLRYQDMYGEADTLSVMLNHVSRMSQEIALMEVFGPNPNLGYQWLKDMIKADAPTKQLFNEGFVDAMYNVASGSADVVAEGKVASALAGVSGFTSHFLVADQLGSAFLSSIADPALAAMTRSYNGIPSVRSAKEFVGQLSPTNKQDRIHAAHLGIIVDGLINGAVATLRHGGDMDVSRVGKKLSDSVMRASYLQQWTEANRTAFGLDFLHHLGKQTGSKLDDMEPKFQAMMRRYGITDAEWDVIRKSELDYNGDVTYFRPENIRNLDGLNHKEADDLISKVFNALNTETDFANPAPSTRERAIMTGGKQRGTAAGEGLRSLFMYKGFSLSMMNTHLMRGLTKRYDGKYDAKYLMALVATTSVLGGISLQLKDISKGKTPRDWQDPKFLSAAIIQGGGLGIFGDFFYTGFSGQSRHGHNMLVTMLGPKMGFMSDTVELGFATAGSPLDEDSNIGREAARYMKKYTPYNSLWQTRLITERMFFDQIQYMADPKAKKNWRKYEKKVKQEYDQKFWWKKGETAPRF